MRLIDGDALVESLLNEDMWTANIINVPTKVFKETDVMWHVVHAPRVDAVRHGTWLEAREKDPCQYICSACKRFVDDDSNYCPNCGAKMDGGGDA